MVSAFIVVPTSFIASGLTFEKKAHFIQIEGWSYFLRVGGPIFGRLQSIIFIMHHLTSHDKMTC